MTTASSAVNRYLSTGAVDPNFGTGGESATPTGVAANGLAIQVDGSILVAGSAASSVGSQTDMASPASRRPRYDPSFGTNGVMLSDLGGTGVNRAYAVGLTGEGKVVAAGIVDANQDRTFTFAAVDPSPVDQVADFTFRDRLGTDLHRRRTGLSGLTATHTYDDRDVQARVQATDKDGLRAR